MATDPTGKKPIISGQPGLKSTTGPVKNPNLPSFAELVSERQDLLSRLDGARKEASTLRTESDAAFSKADALRAKGDKQLVAAIVPSDVKKDERDKELFKAQKETADKVFGALMAFAEARLQNVVAENKFLLSLDASSRASDYEREIGGLENTKNKVLKNEQIQES